MRGIGTDIIEIDRIRASIARHREHFLNRIYTTYEQDYCLHYSDPAPHFAGRFAAKEAVIKALGTGFRHGFTWLDIEIRNDNEGKPEVLLSQQLRAAYSDPQIMVSISHCRNYATATAIWN